MTKPWQKQHMAHAHHHHSIEDTLTAAEAVCAAAGETFTPLRRRVMTLLLESEGPAKAYDLLARISTADHQAKPPTVYRALDFLVRLGLVHKIESLNAFVACDLAHPGHAAAFLICDSCGAASEVDADTVSQALAKAAAVDGFEVKSSVVEARGRCGTCASAA